MVVHSGQQALQVSGHGRVMFELVKDSRLPFIPLGRVCRLVENSLSAEQSPFDDGGLLAIHAKFRAFMGEILFKVTSAIHMMGMGKLPKTKM